MLSSFPLIFLSSQDSRWLEFIQANPQATLFHHPAWIDLLSRTYGYKGFILAVPIGDDGIGAGVPLMEIHSPLTGHRWVSLPFTDHCIPLFQNDADLQQLTEGLVTAFEQKYAPHIQLKWAYPKFPSVHGHSEFVLHRLKLSTNEEEVAGRIKHKQFRQIRVAQERGVRIERGTDSRFTENFYHLHLQTRRRKGVPIQPRKFFTLLEQEILRRGLGFILLAYKESQCVAGAVFLHWNDTLVYKYSASNETGRQLLAMDLLLWEAISWACQNGCQWMDMGRTDNTDEGLRNFKLRWGAEEMPLFYSDIPSRAQGKAGAILGPLMKNVITRTPPWVGKVIGEALYRHFG